MGLAIVMELMIFPIFIMAEVKLRLIHESTVNVN